MLTRREDLAPQQKYYADSLLTLPTMSQSVYHNLAASFATPAIALHDLDSDFATIPEGKNLHDALNAVEMENETPGMGLAQRAANQVASIVGYGINPLMWGFGRVSGLAVRGLGSVAEKAAPNAVSVFMKKPLANYLGESLSKWVPEQIGKEGSEKTLSAALVSQKTLENFGTFAGAGVPIGIVNNFNQDTGHISWGGVARDAGQMGAFGIAIGSIPFALGVVKGKINRALGEKPSADVNVKNLNEALEQGSISPEEHQWYMDYLEHRKTPEDTEKMDDLQKRASDIVGNNGHRVNTATHEVPFDMINEENMRNLQGAIPDQLVADVPENFKKSLSNFLIHNNIDEIRENPQALDGVRGYVDFINEKLLKRGEKTEEAENILDTHLMKGAKENMPFSQKEILSNMKKSRFGESHTKNLPISIPENLTHYFKKLDKISSLELKNKKLFKEYKKSGNESFVSRMKSNNEKIEEIKGSLPKTLTPKEELAKLREDLIPKGDKLKEGFERSPSYHRLSDLAQVWHNARTLLDRVHMEHEYNRQAAFKDLASHILNIADSDLPRIADPKDVINYLKARIEGTVFKEEPLKEASLQEKSAIEIPSDADTILSEQEEQVKKTKSDTLSEEFNKSADKFKEFKSSENVFKNLISCVLGGLNAEG